MPEMSEPRVVFAHGKESGPWGSKIQHLAAIARSQGFAVESLDYSDLMDASARVERLLAHAPTGTPLMLVGSSMGGYVAAMACEALAPDALLLMAPALYLEGYPGDPSHCPDDTVVIHGWDDDIVPLEGSYAFASARRAALHVVADGHRLAESIELIGELFSAQLQRARDRG
ncbi:YqiA/YcfP family alpha/beta fold hydrolase [Salinisphaera sp.]|uniref:YqiA/YcfP family alpha/beta fold hydrolase n=1 Tax=Salinisphaera sp. TaxID=1914330 RepID=UPI0025D36A95|nr:YqiA/YcfP family alpha/beta fold hydrolase [Salinisphaera sp.]